jgi:hypothetical protein
MLPPLCAVATSQSTVDNAQVQSGDVTSSQTLNVVDVPDGVTAVTTATGNSVSSAVVSGSLDVQSSQSLSGNVAGQTAVGVATNGGVQTSLTTAATGNTGDIGSYQGGPATGATTQTVGAVNVTADSQFDGSAAQTDQALTTTQAIANAQGITTQDTSGALTASQSSAAVTQASGTTSLQYTPGTAAMTASAVSNTVTGQATGNGDLTMTVNQSMTGARTQAGEIDGIGNGQTVVTAATATDNNITATTESGSINLTETLDNNAYTRAETVQDSYQFGSAQSQAVAYGDSVLAGASGPGLTLNNTQTNNGGDIVAVSTFSGHDGYDAASSATASGNAVTGYACSDCGGVVNVTNSQTNTALISATSSLDVAAASRSATGVATATGNNATFYVSKPSH